MKVIPLRLKSCPFSASDDFPSYMEIQQIFTRIHYHSLSVRLSVLCWPYFSNRCPHSLFFIAFTPLQFLKTSNTSLLKNVCSGLSLAGKLLSYIFKSHLLLSYRPLLTYHQWVKHSLTATYKRACLLDPSRTSIPLLYLSIALTIISLIIHFLPFYLSFFL